MLLPQPQIQTDGVASVMTLSSEPGINRVQVSAEDLSQTVAFNVEGTVPLSEPMPSEEEMITPMPESMVGQDIETPISTPEPATSLTFDLSLPSGLNLIHIPLKVRAIDGMAQTSSNRLPTSTTRSVGQIPSTG